MFILLSSCLDRLEISKNGHSGSAGKADQLCQPLVFLVRIALFFALRFFSPFEHKLQGQSGPFGRIALEVYVRRKQPLFLFSAFFLSFFLVLFPFFFFLFCHRIFLLC
jgi:hypothetical protein